MDERKDKSTYWWQTDLIDRLEHLSEMLEIFMAALILIGFIINLIPLIKVLPAEMLSASEDSFHLFLERALTLVIGIEFVRMLIKHTPGSVLEVLLFTIARHMVISGGKGWDTVLNVAAIAGIFAIRRYLYVHSFESRRDDSAYTWITGERTHAPGSSLTGLFGKKKESEEGEKREEEKETDSPEE